MHKHTDEYICIYTSTQMNIYVFVHAYTCMYMYIRLYAFMYCNYIAGQLFKCAILGGGFTRWPNRIDKLLFSLKPTDAEHKPKL